MSRDAWQTFAEPFDSPAANGDMPHADGPRVPLEPCRFDVCDGGGLYDEDGEAGLECACTDPNSEECEQCGTPVRPEDAAAEPGWYCDETCRAAHNEAIDGDLAEAQGDCEREER